MVKIKICGVRDAPSVLAAAEAGADYVGFNFVPNSRRRVTVEQAAKLLALLGGRGPTPVGVFRDQNDVQVVVDALGLGVVQLHGKEPAPIVEALLAGGRQVIKAIAVTDASSIGEADGFRELGAKILFDAARPGSGTSFDWSLLAGQADFFLAGGLTAENVGAAIAACHPAVVDTASGIERDGFPSAAKIRAFIESVRAAG